MAWREVRSNGRNVPDPRPESKFPSFQASATKRCDPKEPIERDRIRTKASTCAVRNDQRDTTNKPTNSEHRRLCVRVTRREGREEGGGTRAGGRLCHVMLYTDPRKDPIHSTQHSIPTPKIQRQTQEPKTYTRTERGRECVCMKRGDSEIPRCHDPRIRNQGREGTQNTGSKHQPKSKQPAPHPV